MKSWHSFTYYGGSVIRPEVIIDTDASVDDMLTGFIGYLLACGYHHDSIRDCLESKVSELISD